MPSRLRSQGSQRGQTAAEYMGILLLVAVIVGVLVRFGIGDALRDGTESAIDRVGQAGTPAGETGGPGAPGGPSDPNAPGGPNDPGGPGGPNDPDAPGGPNGPGGPNDPNAPGGPNDPNGPGGPNDPGAPGGPNDPNGPNGPGGPGDPNDPGTTPGRDADGDGRDDDSGAPCVSSAKEASTCLLAVNGPNAVREKIDERARDRFRRSMRDLRNTSARPGTPEYERLVRDRDAARRALIDRRTITKNPFLNPLTQARKYLDPRAKDLSAGFDRIARGLGRTEAPSAPLRPNTASGGPVKPTPAGRFLSGLGKTAKGLGIVGTALGAYDNVSKDGLAKGLTKTAGGVAGAWGGGAAVTAGCAAIGVATAGVGGLACAGVAFGASYLGAKYGSDIAGWAYDRGEEAVDFVDDNVVKPVAGVTKKAAGAVADGAGKVADGAKAVGSALNPFD